jgi:hypothetical protein
MRDYRIDFFRGLARVIIFIDHVPYNFYASLTTRNYGRSDAAEAFVLISGISAAYAYYGRFVAGERLRASGLALKRATVLYIAHLFGTIAMLGIFAAGAIWLDRPHLVRQNNVGPFIDDPVHGSLGVVTLGHQFGYFNILPMYMVFLFGLPVLMVLVKRSHALALTVSFALYAAAGTWRLNIPNYPLDGGWYFNPLAWQFLFTLGFVAGARLRTGLAVPYAEWAYRLALAYVNATAIWVLGDLWGSFPDLQLPFILGGNDKTFLTGARLLHVLAVAYVIRHTPIAGWWKRTLTSVNPLVMIGRNGLVSFCAATLLSMVGLVLKSRYSSETAADLVFDTLFIAAGLLALTAIAAALELLRKPAMGRAAPIMVQAENKPAAPMVPAE